MASKITVAELLVSIGVDSKDAEKAANRLEKRLGKLSDATDKNKRSTKESDEQLKRWKDTAEKAGKVADGLSKVLKVASVALLAIGTGVIKTGSDFETLSARLKTVTGSAEAADEALAFVKDFAKDTPFQVGEITDAFIKLRNLGIEPTEKRLTAFGNIAAGNSKSLDQFTEAVLDAGAGEFERLKEFGIRAKQNGDQVALTFRGLTTSVGNNTADITDFLTELGQNDFAGAMAERMMTLDGVISNAKDAFTNFLLEIAQDGPLKEFKALIGDLVKGTGDKEGLAKILSRTLTKAIRGLRSLLQSDFIGILKQAASVLEFVVENWQIFIGLIAGAKTLQAFNVAAAGFSKLGIAAGAALGPIGVFAGAMLALIPIATKVGEALGDALPGFIKGKDTKQRTRTGAPVPLGELDPQTRAQIKELDAQFTALEATGAGAVPQGAQQLQDIADARAAVLKSGEESVRARRSAERKQGEADAAAQAGIDRAEEAELAGLLIGPQFLPEVFKSKGGGRSRKKKKTPKSIDTVSGFFRAAQAGDLGAIAARTPSTKDIEPTVAIDITNITNNFENKFNIKSSAPSEKLAKDIAMQIKKINQGERSSAGQQIASNLVR